MKHLIILYFIFSGMLLCQEKYVKGKIIDAESSFSLSSANIKILGTGIGTTSDKDGNFELTGYFSSLDTIQISYLGYYTKQIPVEDFLSAPGLIVKMEQKIIPSQTVLVEGSIGKEGITPLAFSKIKRKDIEEDYTIQDIPEFLSTLPSTTFYSEGGSEIGYNYLSIRGFDQRRISVSINGIPQNDPEDHNVYWLDFPDLLASTDIIQVQRGAGSGVFGYPAIGGSINIITSAFSNDPMINLSAALGSYNERKYSASFSSGLMEKKYSIYARLSRILSSGYRNLAWDKYNSYYLSAVRYDKNLTTQINFYGGPISDGLSYTGLPKFTIKDRILRRQNFSYWEANGNQYTYTILRRPEEIENFSQPHFELLNDFSLNKNISINSALFMVLGDGFYDYDGTGLDTTSLHLTSQYGFQPKDDPSDLLIKAEVDNTQYGWIPKMSYMHNNGQLIIGGEFRIHRSIHWGSITYGNGLPEGLSPEFRVYYFNGAKDIMNGFIHETYSPGDHWNFLGEVQLAYHKYRFYNEHFFNYSFTIDGLYLNPRIGINYKFNQAQNIYLSFARVTREPRLSSYYYGEYSIWGYVPQFVQNPDRSYDFTKPYVDPEIMNDFEFGSSLSGKNFNLSLNLYYMLFNNEIVKNGKLDIFGQPITGNAKRTIHQGIELSASVKLDPIEIFANATYSKNKIDIGEAFVNFIDPTTNETSVVGLDLNGNRIGGFPDFLFNFGISYNKFPLFINLKGRYVGRFYSDNYDSKIIKYLIEYPGFVSYTDNVNDAYFTTGLYVSYSFKVFSALNSSKAFLQVNNIFDNLYSAYAIGDEFFPAAERNFLAGLQIGL